MIYGIGIDFGWIDCVYESESIWMTMEVMMEEKMVWNVGSFLGENSGWISGRRTAGHDDHRGIWERGVLGFPYGNRVGTYRL
jgi:hypothetical protein